MACGYIFCSLWRYYSKFTSKKSISFFLRRVLCYEPHELEIPDYINRVPPWLANIPFICLDQLCPGSWVSENLLSYFSSWSASSLRPLPLLSWGLRPHLEYVVCGRLLSKRVGTQPFFPFLASIPMSVSCRGCLDPTHIQLLPQLLSPPSGPPRYVQEVLLWLDFQLAHQILSNQECLCLQWKCRREQFCWKRAVFQLLCV